ncbi:MAG TPA: DUF72 domain-containing protein [Vicinamibacterales bacterium]|nr:DUF72 domain-containing protein [Vicinamibacterales bacterium]
MSDQLALFDTAPVEDPDPGAIELASVHHEAASLAARLPPGVFFGTSSWSFPGWKGLVYSSGRTQTSLARDGLREYARHPLLRTVGVDRSYYAPMPADDLRAYASQLPPGFRCCFKAPAAVTGVSAGSPAQPSRNPDFLSVDRLVDDLLRPCDAVFRDHTGPIVLEFPPFPRSMRMDAAEFHQRLDRFLGELPSGFDYAVELRDARLLTPAYRELLVRRGVSHTFNYWSAMPTPGEQAAVVPPEDAAFTVVRLLLRPGTWYEDQRDRFTPFNRLVDPDEAMRADVVAIAKRVVNRGRGVFVLVNNKAEGSSPLTVMALARRLADAVAPAAPPAIAP